MRMIRTFHPVGQGAFYSEEFFQNDLSVFRMVYDCGCRQGKENQGHGNSVLADVIGKWAGDANNKIDYLFISHFDFDHVSLLRLLAGGKVSIRRVIMPLLSDREKAFLVNLYRIVHKRDEATFIETLIEAPRKIFGENARIIRVKRIEDFRVKPEEFRDDGQSEQQVLSGTKFAVVPSSAPACDWCYVPCNYECSSRSLQLRNLLIEKYGPTFDADSLSDFSNLIKHWGKGKKNAFAKLKEVYRMVDGNINENSMTVYSGPVNAREDVGKVEGCQVERKCDRINCVSKRKLQCAVFEQSIGDMGCRRVPACVYTGDVDLNHAKIREWYKWYWDNVGTIQIPHHGSRLSFELSPFEEKRYCCPISCSDKCYYKHPHACVTNDLTHNGNFPIRVTESFGFEQRIDV